MPLHIVEHPLIKHKIGLLRRHDLSIKEFRELANEICQMLVFEATRYLPMESVIVQGWAGPVRVERIQGKKLTAVPILRAGLGMLDGLLGLIPGARVSVVGAYRNEETLCPVHYYSRLAENMSGRKALLLDPMLATGGTAIATVSLLKDAGCTDISGLFLVSAPQGVDALLKAHPDVEIFTAALDERLNEQGYILPGLGDAGDRIFGTR